MGPRLDVFLSSGIRASQRRRKNTNCRGQPLHGQGIVEHNVSSSQEKEPWLGRTSQETLVEPLQHRARKKNFRRRPFFFQPKRRERRGRVPRVCGQCSGTSPKPSASSDSTGHEPSKTVFNPLSAPVGLHLCTLSLSSPRSSTGILF